MQTYVFISDGNLAAIDADGVCRGSCTPQHPPYLRWLADGNTPSPYVPPQPIIPAAVDMAQARLALLAAGHLTTVNAAIAAMPGIEGDAARIEWEFRPRVRRDSALTAAMAAMLGLDSGALDTLFTTASAL